MLSRTGTQRMTTSIAARLRSLEERVRIRAPERLVEEAIARIEAGTATLAMYRRVCGPDIEADRAACVAMAPLIVGLVAAANAGVKNALAAVAYPPGERLPKSLSDELKMMRHIPTSWQDPDAVAKRVLFRMYPPESRRVVAVASLALGDVEANKVRDLSWTPRDEGWVLSRMALEGAQNDGRWVEEMTDLLSHPLVMSAGWRPDAAQITEASVANSEGKRWVTWAALAALLASQRLKTGQSGSAFLPNSLE